MRILIAEDDRLSAMVLRRALEKLGHEVTEAHNGDTAWRLLREESFRLIITDWMMPETDGLELCRRIRGESTESYTYVILLTARDRREDRLEGLRAGADDFLVKPLDPAELLARIVTAERILAMQEELHSRTQELQRLHEELKTANALLAEQAVTDPLTGLANRRYLVEHLASAFALSVRGNIPLALLMVDVDHFKDFNDTFGHQAGDEVLCALARTMRDCVRTHDVVARYGGEEFTLLLFGATRADAAAIAERLRLEVQQHPWSRRPITISIGVVARSMETTDALALLQAADAALYESKRLGRNRVSCAPAASEEVPAAICRPSCRQAPEPDAVSAPAN